MAAPELTVERALERLREVFPLVHDKPWRDFEIRVRSLYGDGDRFTIVMFHVDGVGRRWVERSWESRTLNGCLSQCLAWATVN